MSCLCILLLVPLHLNNILLHRLLDSSVSDVSIPFFKYECIYIYTAWNLGCIFHIRAHIYLQFWRTISCYLFKYFLSSSSLPVQNSCKTWWEIFVLGSTFLACFVFSCFLGFFVSTLNSSLEGDVSYLESSGFVFSYTTVFRISLALGRLCCNYFPRVLYLVSGMVFGPEVLMK